MATISKLPSGKYRAQVRKHGVYKARTFDRKSDATHWASDVERAIAGGSTADTIEPPKDMTLAHVIAAYTNQVTVGRTNLANLERIAKRIGSTSIRKLNAVDVQGFVEGRLAEGVGGATLAGDLSALSSVLKWARHFKRIDVNPDLAKDARTSLTTARVDTRSNERTRVPTQDEIARLMAYFEGKDRQIIPVGTLIQFGAASAMRMGEITRIRIEDIQWNEKTVLIRERKDPRRKARNDQIVPLVGDAHGIARQAAGERPEGRLFPYDGRSASAAFSRATRALGIVDLHFHDLRHLAITELFRAGLPMELVAVVSGHRDWKHLKRYTQLNANDVHRALSHLK
ncbi:tyrosine-type recombinase/integrase [Falsihalocynthiibacter sp. CO-5D18]|uniref:tyrosine-type recombinase/integrase n=1 Tax=Falsihalocynthiibacter sp. CO-5D18 TaxID=3240872 RepID=UPI00350F325A